MKEDGGLEEESFEIRILGNDVESSATISVKHFSFGMRVFRAIRVGILLLIVTLLMILIPILHFVLVPVGLIFTFIFFSATYKVKSIILGGQGDCPYCNGKLSIHKRSMAFPFEDICDQCGRQVKIDLKN